MKTLKELSIEGCIRRNRKVKADAIRYLRGLRSYLQTPPAINTPRERMNRTLDARRTLTQIKLIRRTPDDGRGLRRAIRDIGPVDGQVSSILQGKY